MRRFLTALPVLVLAACAGLAPAYVPNITEVTDAARAARDFTNCTRDADAREKARKTLSWDSAGTVMAGTTKGAGSNLGLGATNWAGVGLGGAGGFIDSLTDVIGLSNGDHDASEQSCLLQLFARDHSAVLTEPMLAGNHP